MRAKSESGTVSEFLELLKRIKPVAIFVFYEIFVTKKGRITFFSFQIELVECILGYQNTHSFGTLKW